MSSNIEQFLQDVATAAKTKQNTVPEVFEDAMNATAEKVQEWCDSLELSRPAEMDGGYMITAPTESVKPDSFSTTIGADKVVDLCTNCAVSNEHLTAAAGLVANLCARVVGSKPLKAFRSYGARSQKQGTIAIESLYPAAALSAMTRTLPLSAEAGEESFGIQMDRVEPDLKTLLTISLLQFHTNLTPRVVPIKPTNQSNVTIVRDAMAIFDMSETQQKPTRLIELYKDPSLVNVRAKRIEPLTANAKNGELVAEGVYAFDKVTNLFELALNKDKPGYEKYNHTDFVEDGIVVDGLLIEIAKKTTTTVDDGQGGTTTQETSKSAFVMVKIPYGRGRLTQFTNDLTAWDRRLTLDRFPIRLDASAPLSTVLPAGATNDATVLADFKEGVALALYPIVHCHVNRRDSFMDAQGSCPTVKVIGASDEDAETLLKGLEVKVRGITIDARYNEDNKRKTSVRMEITRRSQSYELPTGRNFVVDTAIGQEGVANASVQLAQIEHIGRDYNNLRIIEEVLKDVHDQNVLSTNDKEIRASLAAQYAAGDKVNPCVYVTTLDMSKMYGLRSADASGDVKGYVRTWWNKLMSALMANSFYAQQLADGATVTFRVITSNEIMGNLFMVKHIHAHLENDAAGTGGVEHVMTLDNGIRLELVTTTFDSMKDMIYVIPHLTNSQESIFNFGTDFDQGTLVGAVTIGTDGGASYHRLFSTTRELLIPTNVIGAVVQVVGCGKIDMTSGELTIIQDADAA